MKIWRFSSPYFLDSVNGPMSPISTIIHDYYRSYLVYRESKPLSHVFSQWQGFSRLSICSRSNRVTIDEKRQSTWSKASKVCVLKVVFPLIRVPSITISCVYLREWILTRILFCFRYFSLFYLRYSQNSTVEKVSELLFDNLFALFRYNLLADGLTLRIVILYFSRCTICNGIILSLQNLKAEYFG